MRKSGIEPRVRALSDEEYGVALRAKLQEEVSELLAAPPEEVAEEMADVREVLDALCWFLGIDPGTVAALQTGKRAERGGFVARIWLCGGGEGNAGPGHATG